MTDTAGHLPSITFPDPSSPPSDPHGAPEAFPAPAPARPPRGAGRAAAYRQRRAERRKAWGDRLEVIAVVGVIILSIVVLVTVWTGSPTLFSSPPPPITGPPIVVSLGTPTVSNVTCGDGGSVTAERIPWINATQPVTTGDVAVRVVELFDGDFVPDANSHPNVTASNLCVGPTPTPASRWYAVLSGPNGSNLFTYTEATAWVSVTSGPVNVGIENGSALTVIENPSLAAKGFGVHILGFVNETAVTGSVTL